MHAFLHVDGERALARPPRSTPRSPAGEPVGPLAGVPLALKDVLTYQGAPTTCGSKILQGWIPPYDATVTQRLLDADIVILGKTNMDEFAMGSSTENSAYGPTHNPWDLDRIPGGSGGGSAAALAAFEAPLAIGTDTGGSIRQPAAVTGTVGVKPTYGGTSRYGLVAHGLQPGPARPLRPYGARRRPAARGDRRPRPAATRPRSTRRCRRWSRRPAPATSRGLKIGVVKELGGDGYAPGVEQRFREAVDAAGLARRRDRRGLLPALRLRAACLLPDPARGGAPPTWPSSTPCGSGCGSATTAPAAPSR